MYSIHIKTEPPLQPHLVSHLFHLAAMGASAAVAGPKQRQWYRNRFMDFVYNARSAEIVAKGLPCIVHCNTSGGFVRLDCTPQNGWTHLCNDAALERQQSSGKRYHISACYADILEPEAWARICARCALLAWAGLGSDADLWALYMNGCWGYKWHDTNYGLHISM